MQRRFAVTLATAVLGAGLWMAGCERKQEMPPMTPEVVAITAQTQRVVLTRELPGRTSAFLVADIRPQVSGLILKRLFAEGSDVKAGQVLYQIDPAPFEALHNSAKANLEAAQKAADRARAAVTASEAGVVRQEATLALAKTTRQRMEDLYKERAVSASERDQAVTAVDVAQATYQAALAQVDSDKAAVSSAEAAIAQAKAAMETTRINLGYTKITAPIDGRIGKSSVTEGALVSAYQAPLATIQVLDPINVDVPQSTTELARLRRSGSGSESSEQSKVKLVLENGSAYPLEGTLKFRDITVDPSTGSVNLRIEVPNPRGVLLPGMFVRAILEEAVHDKAILLPQQAVSRDAKGTAQVMVLNAQNLVELRRLVAERAIGDQWLVTSVLAAGERVIVEGLQKIRPGMPARLAAPQTAKAPAATQPH